MKATMASRDGKPRSCFCFTYPRAFPALFLAGVFAAAFGFAADVLAAAATGARALLTASDFGLVAAFFTAAFFAGFGAAPTLLSGSGFASALAGFAALAFLAALPPPLAARSSISAIASASVIASLSLSLGIVALTPPAVT